MAVFAVASGTALGLAPWLWSRLVPGGAAAQARVLVWSTRLAGALLAGASAWALGHDLFVRFAAWCLS